MQVLHRRKARTLEQTSHQDTEPNLDLIEPRGVLGRIHHTNPMRLICQKGRSRCHRLQNAALALDTQVDVKRTTLRNQAHQRF